MPDLALRDYLLLASYGFAAGTTAWLVRTINQLSERLGKLTATLEHDRGVYEGLQLNDRVTRLERLIQPIAGQNGH